MAGTPARQQAALFAPNALAPRRESRVEPTVQQARSRPMRGRAPTIGEHVCGPCGAAACYGLGEAWFCPVCVPAGFLPGTRAAA
ncbi:MAG: hypothetical protein JSR98_20155 [Proteobacteria bacterium]|nr:hypothetical protein [Pseudomonadota bacterium]